MKDIQEKQSKFIRRLFESHPSIEFNELEKFNSLYDDRFYSRLNPQTQIPKRDLGYNGVKFLLLALQRSKLLFTGFVNSVNQGDIAIAFLVVRSHFESTSSVAYFLQHLIRFYEGEIKYEEIDTILSKLSLGSRVYPKSSHFLNEPNPPNFPDAINVITQIETADKIYNTMTNNTYKIFRDCYDFLSEFCHPNLFGLIIGSKIVNGGTVVLSEKPDFDDQTLMILVNYMMISCTFFFEVYDKCCSYLNDKEETPQLTK